MLYIFFLIRYSKRYTPGPGNYEITQEPAVQKPYPHINGPGFNSVCDRGMTKYPENGVPGPGTYVENHKCIGEMEVTLLFFFFKV